MPMVFFGHGSPMVALEDNATARAWAAIAAGLPRPTAILSVSAHWETRVTSVTAMARPRTIHDFGPRFPKALFDLEYPAPGDPALARRVCALLAPRAVVEDTAEWGLDHGTWSILAHAYPQADIPVVQLGLDVALSAAERYAIGRALGPLRDAGVLIMGSGNIVHNLPAMDWDHAEAAPYPWASRFNAAICAALVRDEPETVLRFERFGEDAALSAPTPEHLWPLIYLLGARRPSDRVRLENDRIEHRSLGMTSVVIEDAA